jgi:hypothetical protein
MSKLAIRNVLPVRWVVDASILLADGSRVNVFYLTDYEGPDLGTIAVVGGEVTDEIRDVISTSNERIKEHRRSELFRTPGTGRD